jgi:hypothetical protein
VSFVEETRQPQQRRKKMSDEKNKAPTHTVYTVRDGAHEGNRAFFTRIGAAWPIKDGTGFSVALDALPANGRIVILPRKENVDVGE